ncbi:metal ABC transporter solute-binding protein, Zn/Mn family [Pseudovibrio flavus]|uniref:metal ABC transporter solute-binding protein, Zn/Mn family n=1 Tax=Pseudovibrio flavus TaxID=2529854 RepID=UPI00211C9BC1|nr:zinc ABC transporter substrate-binding protein [Pseudovibrio flavus]
MSAVATAKEPLNIVATVGMVSDAVKAVGGERVETEALIGSGIDPHSYRQTRNDVVKLGRADAIFANGLFLEAQLEELLLKLKTKKPVFFVGEGISKDKRMGSADYQGRYDPHVWMSPELWINAVNATEAALIELDPEGEAYFKKNADEYRKQIEALADYGDTVLATVPEQKRVLVTAHDAFAYLGRDFGMEVVGIQGVSTNSEAGLNRIEELVNLLVEKKIEAVFVESSVSERNVRALVEGAAARGHKVVIGAELFSDAMGDPGTYEGTYVGMIDHNMTSIARALGGKAPERGLNNKLSRGES